MSKVLLVDFDGVIHKYGEYGDGSITGGLMKGARDMTAKLIRKGYQIWIFTSRINNTDESGVDLSKVSEIEKWLNLHGISYGTHFVGITNYKKKAHMYIDDRAFRFTNWDDVNKYLP